MATAIWGTSACIRLPNNPTKNLMFGPRAGKVKCVNYELYLHIYTSKSESPTISHFDHWVWRCNESMESPKWLHHPLSNFIGGDIETRGNGCFKRTIATASIGSTHSFVLSTSVYLSFVIAAI